MGNPKISNGYFFYRYGSISLCLVFICYMVWTIMKGNISNTNMVVIAAILFFVIYGTVAFGSVYFWRQSDVSLYDRDTLQIRQCFKIKLLKDASIDSVFFRGFNDTTGNLIKYHISIRLKDSTIINFMYKLDHFIPRGKTVLTKEGHLQNINAEREQFFDATKNFFGIVSLFLIII